MDLMLHRDQPMTACTLGILTCDGKVFHTMERPWVPNTKGGKSGEKYVSCVSAGWYRLRPYTRPAGDKCWILSNPDLDVYELPASVPKGKELSTRSLVLIHAANWVRDIIGCIGPGKERRFVDGEWMVSRSRDAMNELHTLIGGRLDLGLTITGGTSTV